MKERINKTGKVIKLVTGGLSLAALMIVNVQVGLNDGSTSDIGVFNLSTAIFTPAAVASTCYLNARQTGQGGACFACTTTSSSTACTSACGSEVCW